MDFYIHEGTVRGNAIAKTFCPILTVGSEVFFHLPLDCVDVAAVGDTTGDGQLT